MRSCHQGIHRKILRSVLDLDPENVESKANPEHLLLASETMQDDVPIRLDPMSDLDLMIKNGWGDTKQINLPKDWRVRHK